MARVWALTDAGYSLFEISRETFGGADEETANWLECQRDCDTVSDQ